MTALRQLNDDLGTRTGELIERLHVSRGTGRMLILLVVAFVFFAALRPSVFLSPLNLQNLALAAPEVGRTRDRDDARHADRRDRPVAGQHRQPVGNHDVDSVHRDPRLEPRTRRTAGARAHPGRAGHGSARRRDQCRARRLRRESPRSWPPWARCRSTTGLPSCGPAGRTLYGSPATLTNLGQATVAGIPILFLVFILAAVLVALLINRTPIGLKIQLEGSNPTAAVYSGIRSRSVLTSTYVVTGLLGGLAGVLFLARNPSASADYGASYVLLVIVIAVLGGTNPTGGFATVLGVVLATLTLQIVASGFTALRLSAYQYAIAQGVILILVMIADQVTWRRRRQRRSRPAALAPQS